MNRANQHALFQATNQGLLGIRQQELNYYINLNVAFGTQAALVGGFTYGIFTQNQANDDTSYSYIFQDIYWITSSGTIAAAVHVILTTMLLQVLGPGLALHGPIGSMAKACEGMRREQKTVIAGFILMMVLFSVSTILSFWAVMSFEAAIGATAVWAIAARFYYYYVERIYLRFYWKEEKELWRREDNHEEDSDNPVRDSDEAAPGGSAANVRRLPSVAGGGNATQEEGKASTGKRFSILPTSLGFRTTSKASDTSASAAVNNPLAGTTGPDRVFGGVAGMAKAVAMEGFMMIKRISAGSALGSLDLRAARWDRRYLVLNFSGQIYVFGSRAEFRDNARKPLFKRPLLLGDFDIVVYNSETANSAMSSVQSSVQDGVAVAETMSVVGGGRTAADTSSRQLFQITLTPRSDSISLRDGRDDDQDDNDDDTAGDSEPDGPSGSNRRAGGGGGGRRREWVLRCDTSEELLLWQESMQSISPGSFPQL